MDNSISLWSLISWISPLLLLLGSCYHLSKGVKSDAVLLVIGSALSLLVAIFLSVLPGFVQRRAMPFTEVSTYYSIVGIIGFFGGICFAVGFFLLVSNSANKPADSKPFL